MCGLFDTFFVGRVNLFMEKRLGGKRSEALLRIKLMVLDHFIMCAILSIVSFFFVGIGYLVVGSPFESASPGMLFYFAIFSALTVFSIYLNKDAIKGKSPAKRSFGFVIINHKTGQIANPIRAVLRNVTIIIWPVEVIFLFFSPERRIGDYIAGTKVILDNKTLDTEIQIGQIIIALIIGIVFMFLISLLQLAI